MDLTVSNIVLTAKHRQIEELRRLASRAELVGAIGAFVHALQAERGASSLYLASGGSRFEAQRTRLVADSEAADGVLRERFRVQLEEPGFGSATLCSLMAWVVLGMDTLPSLRQSIAAREMTADEAVVSFSRLIAGLVSLIFDVADSAVDPSISRLLVALFNLVQGKELAGQERAVGAALFASGRATRQHQQRMLHLIDGQERNMQVFADFADVAVVEQWQAMQTAPCVARLERLRRVLFASNAGDTLDADASDEWFDCCSARLTDMGALQDQLMAAIERRCGGLISEAERDLADSAGLLDGVSRYPPESAELVGRFFSADLPIDGTAVAATSPKGGSESALVQVLRSQSERLASTERELGAARRALQDRKTIERAKGMLMARFGMSEEEAYKTLRRTSMEQNRRIAEVAEATMSVLAAIAPAPSGAD
ncbi:MAG: nitrate- and nitrite sensing domain-containing protein [Rhodocyclaceae bacterium]|nr:nitrate- and nitrite sensing domain-containing protein [Rhodocyclaceae bacterium]